MLIVNTRTNNAHYGDRYTIHVVHHVTTAEKTHGGLCAPRHHDAAIGSRGAGFVW
jgi:hypothetical protein